MELYKAAESIITGQKINIKFTKDLAIKVFKIVCYYDYYGVLDIYAKFDTKYVNVVRHYFDCIDLYMFDIVMELYNINVEFVKTSQFNIEHLIDGIYWFNSDYIQGIINKEQLAQLQNLWVGFSSLSLYKIKEEVYDEIRIWCPRRIMYVAKNIPNEYFYWVVRFKQSKTCVLDLTETQLQTDSAFYSNSDAVSYLELYKIGDLEFINRRFKMNQFSLNIPYLTFHCKFTYDCTFIFN